MNPQWSEDTAARTVEPVPGARRQGLMPMIVGGLMVTVGLLAFLFYDDRPANRDVDTTATTRPAITAPAQPAPDAPSGGITTPTRP
jgi:hypothetical protein